MRSYLVVLVRETLSPGHGGKLKPKRVVMLLCFPGIPRGKALFRPMALRGTGNATWAGDEHFWNPGLSLVKMGHSCDRGLLSSSPGALGTRPTQPANKTVSHWPTHFFSFCHSLGNLLTIFIACLCMHSLNACVYINTIVLNLVLQWLC